MQITFDTYLAVNNLLARYCYCLDNHQFHDLSRLFSADGTWTTHYGEARGPEEIEKLLNKLIPVSPARKHFVANVVIEPDGDELNVKSYYLVVRETETGPNVSVAGTYHDRLQQHAGEWLFFHRRLQQDIVGDLGLKKSK